ncbi:MAG: PDDEXK nuclease domain-containing protein [Desulfobacteraceae bacterium]|nr:PDDEXK nuclease domain-containing protein [Desulfobacteraceae bacterium]
MNFDALVQAIASLHERTRTAATKAVNVALTLRNWLIGAHIVEFEQQGEDRAAYGERLLPNLAGRLSSAGVPRADERELRRFRQFYLSYPQIRDAVNPELAGPLQLAAKREAATPESGLSATLLINRLSFTHFQLLLDLDSHQKRAFYEVESIKGGWSVRELKRQIASLYYERSGLSLNQAALSRLANEAAEQESPALVIRDPFVFEFLGLRPQEVLPESELEAALIARLEEFLRELGHGFCFEARQKRIVIGGEHFFVDLVFYHRVLKCHVLVELKVDAFRHEHLGQLNTYVSYYRAHEMTEGDQPPVGLLLCTGKNHALVEYALAGLDNSTTASLSPSTRWNCRTRTSSPPTLTNRDGSWKGEFPNELRLAHSTIAGTPC